VLIVNYNGGGALRSCLAALASQSIEHDVLIVDNASVDGSAQQAWDAYPHVRILPLRRNVGFARAFNIGVERIAASTDLLVSLNPDTYPDPDVLQRLVAPFDDDPRLAAAAATMVFASAPDVVASRGIVVHRNGVAIDAEIGRPASTARDTLEPVFGASAGAAAYRVAAIRDAGGMAEAFFMYLEDVDLAWRLRLRGWHACSVPAAVVRHEYSRFAVEGSPLKRRLLARNRIWTLARCLPDAIWRRDVRCIIAFDALAIGYGTIRLDAAALRGRAEAIGGLPLRLRERSIVQTRAVIDSADLATWIQPPISPRRLARLRDLTRRLSVVPRE
jgi:GT2 family glycosyltransferase